MGLRRDLDIHTHTGPVSPDRILCVDPSEAASLPPGEGWLSVGIHPWNAGRVSADVRQRFRAWLDDPRVIAVGEIGFDRLRGPEMSVQTAVFEEQLLEATGRGLPVVVHCVRANDILLAMRKKYVGEMKKAAVEPVQWVYHGFRGKAAAARQILDSGIDISFGVKFNAEAFDAVPPERRYGESD